MSGDELKDEAARLGPEIASRQGRLAAIAGEMDRRRTWEDDGATSFAAWLAERNGVSERTGRSLSRLGERLWDLPHLAKAFEDGEIALDKVALVVGTATPENDAEVTTQAKECSVKELADLARWARGVKPDDEAARHEGRYLRFNDTKRTLSGQLPEEDYALVKMRLNEVAKGVESDGETPLDQRRADALTRICGVEGATHPTGAGSGIGSTDWYGRYLVVIHIGFESLRATDSTALAELERFGLISAETARRIACGADVAVAFEDELGHTMYEGRARRLATAAQRRELWRRDQRCRFPGCSHTSFTKVHHIIEWEHGGLTDLSNLVLLCDFHHHCVHRSDWHISGDANGELTFHGPGGIAMTSRPSPLWTKTKTTKAETSGTAGQ
jgi:hypothetical protein